MLLDDGCGASSLGAALLGLLCRVHAGHNFFPAPKPIRQVIPKSGVDAINFKEYTDFDESGKSYKGFTFMATDEERVREHILKRVVDGVPRAYLEDFQRRAPAAYRDEFENARHDTTTVPEQRLSRLILNRVFRLDWELAEAAKAHSLPATSKPLPENAWNYTYVIAGGFGLTQSYVPAIGSLPKPAKFREDLAKAAGVPRLPLDDLYQVKEFYGLLAHNPVGKNFAEGDQQLGSLQFCIPCRDMNSWVFAMSVPELLSHYPAAVKKTSKGRAPTWKRFPETGADEA